MRAYLNRSLLGDRCHVVATAQAPECRSYVIGERVSIPLGGGKVGVACEFLHRRALNPPLPSPLPHLSLADGPGNNTALPRT